MSTQTKQVSHTPGPWAIDHEGSLDLGPFCLRIIAEDPGPENDFTIGFSRDADKATREANARLIAAAPELGQELMRTYHDPQTAAGRAQEIEVVLKKAGLL